MNRFKGKIGSALFIACAFFFLSACEPKAISELSEGDGIQRIRENHDNKNWEVVVNEVNEYRARYPYSQFANDALLIQADAQFQASRYPEAVVSYDEFLQRNKTHPKMPLAAFRVAKALDLQSSESPDREQSNTKRALAKYNEFVVGFSKSEYVAEAKDRIGVLKRRIAEHELFIARFYWKKDLWHAALTRFLELRNSEYKDIRDEANAKAKEAYEHLAKKLEQDPTSDLTIYFKGKTPAELRQAGASL